MQHAEISITSDKPAVLHLQLVTVLLFSHQVPTLYLELYSEFSSVQGTEVPRLVFSISNIFLVIIQAFFIIYQSVEFLLIKI